MTSRIRNHILRLVPFWKIILSGMVLVAGLWLHLAEIEEAHHGIKAAVLGLATASMLFIGLLPSGQGAPGLGNAAVTTFLTRFTGAVLAFLTSWHWVLGETDGKPLQFLTPMLFVVVVAVVAIVTSLILSLGEIFRKQPVEDAYKAMVNSLFDEFDEYERFREALANPDTTSQELVDHALALELIFANLLLALRYNRTPLTEDAFNGIFGVIERSAELTRPGISRTASRIKTTVNAGIASHGKPPHG